MENINQKDYFNNNWQAIDISIVPLKFSLTSKKIREYFIKLLYKNDSIADLGCGLAGNGIIFHRYNPKIIYTGIDIADKAIAKAKIINQNQNSNFLVKNLVKNTLPKNRFSLVYCSQLIEHIKDDELFIKKIYQSLKPNGNLIISTVYKKKNAIYIYKNSNDEIALAPDHINEYTKVNSLLNKLKKSNFQIIDYDLTLFKYPLIDVALKLLMKHSKSKFTIKLVNSTPIMFLRYYLYIPIFGFYNFQIIAKKH